MCSFVKIRNYFDINWDTHMTSGLFSEFESTNKNAWIAQVEKELRKSYVSVAERELSDQAFIEPYYTAEDLNPADTAEVRAAQKRKAGWLNAVEITESTHETSVNGLLPFSLEGVDAIFMPAHPILYKNLQQQADFDKIDLARLSVYWSGVWEDWGDQSLIGQHAQQSTGGISDDPLATFVKNGQDPLPAMHRISKAFSQFSAQKNFRLFAVNSEPCHELGADPVQELAYLASGLVYYLDQLTDLGIASDQVLQRMFFSVPVGTDYFTEIAKLRALRVLYQRVAGAYRTSVLPDDGLIHATTSRFYQSSIALEENMLRNTSEAMSAIIGGCDLLTVRAHDPADVQLAPRIARNVSLILRHESHLQNNADPAAGSYLLDQMTYVLVEKAWNLFLEMERKGGFADAWVSGFTPALLEQSWQRKIAEARAGRIVVGANRYANGANLQPEPAATPSNRSVESSLSIAGKFSNTDRS